MAGSTLDAEARARLVVRLRTLQWKLDAAQRPADEVGLAAGEDDDIFAVIDRTLGLS